MDVNFLLQYTQGILLSGVISAVCGFVSGVVCCIFGIVGPKFSCPLRLINSKYTVLIIFVIFGTS